MANYFKSNFNQENKHNLLGANNQEGELNNDNLAEVTFGRMRAGFVVGPHIHTQTKTLVIVLKGEMVFKISGEEVAVREGEYIIFSKGIMEEVIRVVEGTENLTIHTPSIKGGDGEKVR